MREASWTAAGWVVADDTATADGSAAWDSPSGTLNYGLMVEARFSSIAWTGATGRVLVAVDGDALAVGAGCALEADRDGDGKDELAAFEIGGTTMTTSLGIAVDPGAAVEITAWRSIDALHNTASTKCIAQVGTLSKTIVIPTDTDITGNYAMSADAVHAVATSVIVYTSPGPPMKGLP